MRQKETNEDKEKETDRERDRKTGTCRDKKRQKETDRKRQVERGRERERVLRLFNETFSTVYNSEYLLQKRRVQFGWLMLCVEQDFHNVLGKLVYEG